MAREGTGNPQPPANGQRLDHIEGQIQGLRVETRTEFTQLRGEMNAGFTQLRGEMTAGFTQLRGEMTAGFAKTDAQFARIDERLDGMQRTMVQAVIAMTAAILAGFGGILAVIATQL